MKLLVLMYHVVYKTDIDFQQLADEEKPYAISETTFRQQLNILKKSNLKILDSNDISKLLVDGVEPNSDACIVTVDDGHKSMLSSIEPILTSHSIGSIFFVTTGLVEAREDFCTWEDLLSLSNKDVMVQAHGDTHDFFDTMTPEVVAAELKLSKQKIENKLDCRVNSLSYPGGRWNNFSKTQAEKEAYTHQFLSKVGYNQNYKHGQMIERVAIRASTSLDEFQKICGLDFAYYKKAWLIQNSKQLIKKIIGSNTYHQLYKWLKK